MDVQSLPQPVAYALTGGASNGAVHAGMLQAAAEAGLAADLVAGTSVGAINGVVIAEDPLQAPRKLVKIWSELSTADVFSDGLLTRLRNLARSRRYLYSGRGLRRLLQTHLSARTFDDLVLPFAAIATDVLGGHQVMLRRGRLDDAVAASAAIPGILPNVSIGGSLLVDGGVVANAPVQAALDMGASSIVLFDAGYACHLMEPPNHVAARVLHATSVMVRRQVERDVEAAARQVPVVALPALCPLRSSPLDFSSSVGLIEEAYETSRRFLTQVRVRGPGVYGHLHRHDGPTTTHQL